MSAPWHTGVHGTNTSASLVPYETRGGLLPATLLLTHGALLVPLGVLAYLAIAQKRFYAVVLFVHFLAVGLTSPLWHLCSSYDECPARDPINHQIIDHFTSLTAIPLLLIFGMPALPLNHSITHTLLVYIIHAHDMAGDPARFQDARVVVYVYSAIYVLHHHARYTAAGTAAQVAARVDSLFDSSTVGPCCGGVGGDESAIRRYSRGCRRALRAPGTLAFTGLSVRDALLLFCVSVVAGSLYGAHVAPRAAGYVHAGWHVVAFLGAAMFVALVAAPGGDGGGKIRAGPVLPARASPCVGEGGGHWVRVPA